MSTEHQRYSTENQSDAIRQYADCRSLQVIKTYADEGKSGLRLDGRDALKRLIDDVQNGTADFTTILVYDVTLSHETIHQLSGRWSLQRLQFLAALTNSLNPLLETAKRK